MNSKAQLVKQLARLIAIRPARGNSLAFRFQVIDDNGSRGIYTWYAKSIGSADNGSSLKTICYFLNLPFDDSGEFNYDQLIGRSCYLIIGEKRINGNLRPDIRGFAFSDSELYEGNKKGIINHEKSIKS
jgi:hypothetical protein